MATKTATVQSGQAVGTHTNFPAYVDLADVGITTLAEAESVRVYSDSGLTTELAREIVSATEMHVKIPSLTSSTQIWIDYDSVRVDYAVTDTYGRNAVWTNGYTGVYHLNEHSTIINSTGGTNGTGFSTVAGDVVDGAVGKGLELLSNGDYLSLPTGQLNTYSLQFLYKKNGNTSSQNAGLERWVSTGNATRLQNFRITTSGTAQFEARNGTGAQNISFVSTSNTLGNNSWRWLCVTITSGEQRMYLDGVNESTTTVTHGNNTTASNFYINRTYDSTARYANATYDEVRIKSGVLSANWITTEYNNQNDNASFWGTWTDAGGGVTKPNFKGFARI